MIILIRTNPLKNNNLLNKVLILDFQLIVIFIRTILLKNNNLVLGIPVKIYIVNIKIKNNNNKNYIHI